MSSVVQPKLSRPLRKRSQLFDFQQKAIALLAQKKQMGVFLKMGLGKTPITLTTLVDLGNPKTLVIAPANVVKRNVWGIEASAWEHTQQLRVQALVGTPTERRSLLAKQASIEVVSYELINWLTEEVNLEKRYRAIIFDELSKLKHPGTARFRRLRARAGNIPIRFGLTGSPVGNHLLDLWGEMFMVAGPKPLGPRFVDYRAAYFSPVGYNPKFCTWQLRHPTCEAAIHAKVKPWCVSLNAKLAAGWLPKLKVNPLVLELPENAKALERKLTLDCVVELGRGKTIEALGASALAGKLRQLASGAAYTTEGESAWAETHTVKIDMLREILDEQQGEPVLCFYWYKHELARLQKAFPEAREATDPMALLAWDRREVPLLLAHPQSAGHGLNLQLGGSTIVWFTLPWSHELWEQGNGRECRVGQLAPYVTAHVLLAGEMDLHVLDVLMEKGATQGALMSSVELGRALTLEEMLS
jgi:hypothetical protein